MSAVDSQRFIALGQEWTARFDFNSICEIEERTGQTFMAAAAPFLALIDPEQVGKASSMVALAERVSFSNMRLLLCWALEGAHPDITLHRAGEIVNEIGMAETMALLSVAIARGLPQGRQADGSGKGGATGAANPRKAARKTPRKGAKAG